MALRQSFRNGNHSLTQETLATADVFDTRPNSSSEFFSSYADNFTGKPESENKTDTSLRRFASMETTEFAVGVTEFLVFIFGTPANLLVLYLAWRILSKKRRKQHGQWPVLTMTAFDLLFCTVHGPLMFAQLVLKSPFTIDLCVFMHFFTHASTTGSSLSLLLLNLDKFVHLYKPLHYPALVTKRKTIASCVFVSVLAFSWAAFLMFGPFTIKGVSDQGQCKTRFIATEVYVFLAVVFFLLPTLASLGISVFTATVVIRSRRSCLLSKKTKDDECSSQTEAIVAKRNYTSKRKVKSEPNASAVSLFKIIGFVFTTTVWSSVTCLPYRIAYLWYVTRTTPLDPIEHFRMFTMFALMVLNAVGNPFVTVITQHQYTEGVRKLIRRTRRSFSRSLKENSASGSANDPRTQKRHAGTAVEMKPLVADSSVRTQRWSHPQTPASPVQRLESKKFKKRLSS